MSETSEMDYLKGEQKSDVLFNVEGQTIPALKSFLAEKSRVFGAMFSENFKESKVKEIFIEDTTYEAFNTFIGFLYNNHLILDIDNEYELILELYRLSDRYDVSYFEHRITDELTNRYFLNEPKCVSDEDFNRKWLSIRSIARLANESQVSGLIKNVMTFIDTNMEYFLKKDIKELNQLNDSIEGRLLEVLVNKCRKTKEDEKYQPFTVDPFIDTFGFFSTNILNDPIFETINFALD